MHFIKLPTRALTFNPSPVQVAVLVRLCFTQFQYEKRGHAGTPFFFTDRELAAKVGCSTWSIYKAKAFWRDNGVIRFWVGPKNRTYYVIQYDVPKISKYPLPPNTIQQPTKYRSAKPMPLSALILPPFSPPK